MELLFIGSPQHVKKLIWNAVSIKLLWFKAKLLIQPNSLELDPNRIFSIGTIAKPKLELNTKYKSMKFNKLPKLFLLWKD